MRLDEAREYVRRGNELKKQGLPVEAEAAYLSALDLEPEYAEAHNNIGELYAAAGRTEQAQEQFERAISINPGYAEAHNNLGKVLLRRGDELGATAAFLRAVNELPCFAEANLHLAECLSRTGNKQEAASYGLRAVRSADGRPDLLAHYVDIVRDVVFSAPDEDQRSLLHECFAAENIDRQDIVRPAASLIKLDPCFAAVTDAIALAEAGDGDWELVRSAALDLLDDGLFLDLVSQTYITDIEIEMAVRGLRRLALKSTRHLGAVDLPLLRALATQCSNTEWVYSTSSEEAALLAGVQGAVSASLTADFGPGSASQEPLSLVLTMYPSQDATRAARVRNANDAVSSGPSIVARVKQQYEENPFPRWLSTRTLPPISLADFLRLQFPRFAPPSFSEQPVSILVAGCGTGKQAIDVALRHPDSKVLAIDVSSASLRYAEHMARRLDVENVEFRQMDINDVDQLGVEFDFVECSGVLHHTPDPEATWTTLAAIVRSAGLMNIGLYSRLARRTITRLRERNRKLAIVGAPDEIRAFRDEVICGELAWARAELLEWRDFFTLSGLRDLIFNAHEDPFDIPRIQRALRLCGLRFIGFVFRDQAIPDRYRGSFPDDPLMQCFDNWAKFEEEVPQAFRNMYQLYCQKQP